MSEEQIAAFESWWNASKYRQVIYADSAIRQVALDGWQAALSAKSVPVGLFEYIEHGDIAHREWLKKAIDSFFNGTEKPAYVPAAPQVPTDDERVRVLDSTIITAMKDGYRFFYHEPASYLTDEANTELAWGVERSKAPYCGKDGIRYWTGANPLDALEKCKQAIASMSGEQP